MNADRLIHGLKDAVLRRRRGLPLADGTDLDELLEQAAEVLERLQNEIDDHFDTRPFS